MGLFKGMKAHPSAYGFDAMLLDKGCLVSAFGEAERTLCSDPDHYIFWDEYHVGSCSFFVICVY